MHMSLPARRLTAIVVTAGLAAAAAFVWLATRPEPPVATALMTDPQSWTVWPEASETLTGTLDVSEEGCVVLRRPSGDVLIIAERGSRLLDGGRQVEISRVGTFALGESISRGGAIGESWRGGRRFTPPEWDQCVGPETRTVPTAALAFTD
jgi:hypothetical protein